MPDKRLRLGHTRTYVFCNLSVIELDVRRSLDDCREELVHISVSTIIGAIAEDDQIGSEVPTLA